MLMVSMLLALVSMTPAHAATPPAGTAIGNQASATYTDGTGISRSVTSNTVQTIVQQVASLTLTANGAQNASPGSSVYYPHTLTNTGNGSDSFNLAAINASGFNMTGIQIFADNGSGQPTGAAITSSGALAAGASFKFIVVATVPTSATSGLTNGLTVTATSVFTTAPSVSNTDTTTVTSNGVITLTKSVSADSGAAGSGPYTYTLTYTNTGNSNATAVTVTDVLPAGLTYAAGSGRWSVTGTTALSDTGGTSGSAPNTIVSTYTAASTTLKYVVNQVAPGQSGTVTFQVNVASSAAPGVINNTATDAYNDGATTVTGSSNTVPFTVTQAASVTLTGATVASATPGAIVSFTNVVKNTGNGTDTFDVTFGSNSFPPGTSFTLYKSDGVTPLTDTNNNSTPDTGPLAPNATYNVIVKAQLPANASGGAYTVDKTATSSVDPTKSATTTDTLTSVTGASVDLTNDRAYNSTTAAPGQGAGPEGTAVVVKTVAPGQTTTIVVYVNNTGPVSDSYALAASTVSDFSSITLPSGWVVTFKADGGAGGCSTTGATLTSTGNVPAGSSAAVCAVVTVPATGAGAAAATSQLYFRGASAASGAKDIIHDAVTVGAARSISFTPNNTNQTYPGGTVFYSHTLTNNGNVVEGNGSVSTITLPSSNSKTGWTSVLYYDANNNGQLDPTDPVIQSTGLQGVLPAGLSPGQSITIIDKVTAPSGAQIGEVNTSTITVTTANGSYTSTPAAVVIATDGTTIIAGNLQLTKKQALDTMCTGPTGSTVYSQANVNALPGQCVLYQITVSNVGSADATTVVVSDATPTFTTISPAATSVAKTTVGTITGPSAGASGTVSASIGTLSPAQSAVVTFGVKIQN
jgi:uncharacterized repeat protein (TIGR01451 family)